MTTNNNAGCLSAIFSIFSPKKPTQIIYPYRLRKDFLSPAEFTFYKVLESTIKDKLIIQCKVGLGDIFEVDQPNKNKGYSNRINQKHVDFLLCEPSTIKPILGIELDDATHKRPDRQERDKLVENIFRVAKLPLLRIPVRQAYSPQELFTQIKNAVTKQRQERAQNIAELKEKL